VMALAEQGGMRCVRLCACTQAQVRVQMRVRARARVFTFACEHGGRRGWGKGKGEARGVGARALRQEQEWASGQVSGQWVRARRLRANALSVFAFVLAHEHGQRRGWKEARGH